MTGIYKITKKSNGKSYIGQSNDIERRFSEHKNRNVIPIDVAIHKYGADAFNFEVLEECKIEDLNEREMYWIDYYNTYLGDGYNCYPGGTCCAGENNANTKLTDKDVEYIRDCYNNHERRRKVYELFKDKISFASFASIWDGSTWKHIKPEVYTPENKEYYMYHATDGGKSDKAAFTSEEVLELRKRYVNEDARSIYKDCKDRCAYGTLQHILMGTAYKDVPIYRKKQKKWVNV